MPLWLFVCLIPMRCCNSISWTQDNVILNSKRDKENQLYFRGQCKKSLALLARSFGFAVDQIVLL